MREDVVGKWLFRLNAFAILIFYHVNVTAAESSYVFIKEDPERISFVDDTFFATYDYVDNSYQAFDIRDSGFPEVQNPKNIFDNLKLRYLKQEPIAIEGNNKEN